MINGRYLFPFCGYVNFAWRAYATYREIVDFTKFSVEFHDLRAFRPLVIPHDRPLVIRVSLTPQTGRFEICNVTNNDETAVLFTGQVQPLRFKVSFVDVCVQCVLFSDKSLLGVRPGAGEPTEWMRDDRVILDRETFYTEVRLAGYEYGALVK